eukprot:3280475-Rhodomonas_salina.3
MISQRDLALGAGGPAHAAVELDAAGAYENVRISTDVKQKEHVEKCACAIRASYYHTRIAKQIRRAH